MPVGPGRYRTMTTKSGKKVRLHFTPGGDVNEAKSLSDGGTHTPAEFAAEEHQPSPRKPRNSYRRKR